MIALDLLAELRSAGVTLTVNAGRLRVDAPRGVLTDDLRATLAAHKTELLALLAGHVAVGDLVYLLDDSGQTHNLEPWRVDAIVEDADGPLAIFVGRPFASWPLALCRRTRGAESGRADRRAS